MDNHGITREELLAELAEFSVQPLADNEITIQMYCDHTGTEYRTAANYLKEMEKQGKLTSRYARYGGKKVIAYRKP